MKYFKSNNVFAQKYVDDFIKTVIENEIVPDILIETLRDMDVNRSFYEYYRYPTYYETPPPPPMPPSRQDSFIQVEPRRLRLSRSSSSPMLPPIPSPQTMRKMMYGSDLPTNRFVNDQLIDSFMLDHLLKRVARQPKTGKTRKSLFHLQYS